MLSFASFIYSILFDSVRVATWVYIHVTPHFLDAAFGLFIGSVPVLSFGSSRFLSAASFLSMWSCASPNTNMSAFLLANALSPYGFTSSQLAPPFRCFGISFSVACASRIANFIDPQNFSMKGFYVTKPHSGPVRNSVIVQDWMH